MLICSNEGMIAGLGCLRWSYKWREIPRLRRAHLRSDPARRRDLVVMENLSSPQGRRRSPSNSDRRRRRRSFPPHSPDMDPISGFLPWSNTLRKFAPRTVDGLWRCLATAIGDFPAYGHQLLRQAELGGSGRGHQRIAYVVSNIGPCASRRGAFAVDLVHFLDESRLSRVDAAGPFVVTIVAAPPCSRCSIAVESDFKSATKMKRR
jgi:hypothetical protein